MVMFYKIRPISNVLKTKLVVVFILESFYKTTEPIIIEDQFFFNELNCLEKSCRSQQEYCSVVLIVLILKTRIHALFVHPFTQRKTEHPFTRRKTYIQLYQYPLYFLNSLVSQSMAGNGVFNSVLGTVWVHLTSHSPRKNHSCKYQCHLPVLSLRPNQLFFDQFLQDCFPTF